MLDAPGVSTIMHTPSFGDSRRPVMRTSVMALVALILVIVSFDTAVAQTAERDDACIGTDLIFLIDESDSMIVNDPDYLRIVAVRTAITALGDNAMYFCPGVYHRIAAIGFGDSAYGRPDTENYLITTISPTTEGLNEWKAKREELRDLLPLRTNGLGGTDYMSAFGAAKTILDVWMNETSSLSNDDQSNRRRRGVVVISDGRPCIIDDGCNDASYNADIGRYMADLARYLDPLGPSFPWRGSDHPLSVRIWFVGLNDTATAVGQEPMSSPSEVGTALFSTWREIVENHGGEVKVPSDREDTLPIRNPDILPIIQDILAQVAGKFTWSSGDIDICEPIFVDPYGSRLALYFFYPELVNSDEDGPRVITQYLGPLGAAKIEGARIISDESVETTMLVSDYTRDGSNERYVISRPQPGTWQSIVGTGSCRVTARVAILQRNIVGEPIEPRRGEPISHHESEPYYDAASPRFFRYSIMERDISTGNASDVPLTEVDFFPISVTGTITTPIGSGQGLQFARQDTGVWQSIEPLRLPTAGTYSWMIVASAPDGGRTGSVNIHSDHGTFEVTGNNQFGFSILKPRGGKPLPSISSDEVQDTMIALPVEVQLTNSVGEPLDIDTTKYLGARDLLTAELLVGQTVVVSSPMTLNPETLLFETSLDLSRAVLVRDAEDQGNATVMVRLNPASIENTGFSSVNLAKGVNLGDQIAQELHEPIAQDRSLWLIPIILAIVLVLASGIWLLRRSRDRGSAIREGDQHRDGAGPLVERDARHPDSQQVTDISPPQAPLASSTPASSRLTRSKRWHLETEQARLELSYATLTERISAVNIDIGRELDSERKLMLEKRLQASIDERQKVIEQLEAIEKQLGR